MRKMSKTETKQTTEEKEEVELAPFETAEISDFMEHTQSAIISIKAILQKFKDDYYQKQENGDELDELLEEVQDSIECMGNHF